MMDDVSFIDGKKLTFSVTIFVTGRRQRGAIEMTLVRPCVRPSFRPSGRRDGQTDGAILICHPKFLWGHKKVYCISFPITN